HRFTDRVEQPLQYRPQPACEQLMADPGRSRAEKLGSWVIQALCALRSESAVAHSAQDPMRCRGRNTEFIGCFGGAELLSLEQDGQQHHRTVDGLDTVRIVRHIRTIDRLATVGDESGVRGCHSQAGSVGNTAPSSRQCTPVAPRPVTHRVTSLRAPYTVTSPDPTVMTP